jgi:Flp pilus assembly protein TadB
VRADHAAALLALAAALLVWSPAALRRRQRVRRVAGRDGSDGRDRGIRRSTAAAGRPATHRRLAALAAGLGVGLLVGGPAGVVAGFVAAGGAEWLLRRARGTGDGPLPGAEAALPVGCDLLAVCLAAGVPPGAALAGVAAAVPEPLSGQLRGVAALYGLGAEPGRAWAEAAPTLQPLARVFVRAGESGSAAGPALRALAVEFRSEARSRAQARVQRAGVWVLAPLGACFLPAFLCLGVVPLVLGIAGDVFH